MNLKEIEGKLKTVRFGRQVVYIEEVGSTNSYTADLYREGKLTDGLTVIALRQTAGKGRLGRSWHSEGGLAMTVAVELPEQVPNLSPITLTAGASVAMALTELSGLPVRVKYPNDLMYEDKKLGGILAEHKNGRNGDFVLLGIGINVAQESFPKEIENIAVSLYQLGVTITIEKTVAEVLNKMEPLMDLFLTEGFPRVRPYWLEVNGTIGRDLSVQTAQGPLEGRALTIDDDGALLLETAEGIARATTGDFMFRGV